MIGDARWRGCEGKHACMYSIVLYVQQYRTSSMYTLAEPGDLL